MKNNILLKLNVCACAVLLAACGGGGGGSPSTQSEPSANSSGANPVNTNDISQFGGTQLQHSKTKLAYKRDVGGSANTIVVDGQSVTLIPEGINGKTILMGDSKENRFIFNNLSYTRFGLYENKEQEKQVFFAQGQLTNSEKVPSTGTAVYTGHAVYGVPNAKLADGVSKFDVDYGAKTISGVISSEQNAFSPLTLKGIISGSDFNGTHEGVYMQGHFFGANAEELGGTFHKGDSPQNVSFGGAFGAKKQ